MSRSGRPHQAPGAEPPGAPRPPGRPERSARIPEGLEPGPAIRATVLFSVHDRAGHRSLAVALLKRARQTHLAGATLFEGRRGFGASGRPHHSHVLHDDSPASLVLIDRSDKIATFLDDAADLLAHTRVILEPVQVVAR